MRHELYLLSTTSVFGGGEIYQLRLTALLREHFHVVAVSPPLPALKRGMAELGAGYVELSTRGRGALRLAMLRWLWRQRTDGHGGRKIILLNGRGAAYLAPFVRLIHGDRPFVISHTALSMQDLDIKESLFGRALRSARCVVAVSDALADQHRRRWPALPVIAIPNWIEPLEHMAALRPAGSPPTPPAPRSVVVARLEPSKGVEDVVAAFAVEGQGELHVYGDGSLRGQLDGLARQLDWLRVLGHVEDLPQRLPQYSILISASRSESFSYTVAEGILAGLLCVISDIPAHRELLGERYPAMLFFKPGDRAALARALREAQSLLTLDQGTAAREAVQEARARIQLRNSAAEARGRYLKLLLAEDSCGDRQ